MVSVLFSSPPRVFYKRLNLSEGEKKCHSAESMAAKVNVLPKEYSIERMENQPELRG